MFYSLNNNKCLDFIIIAMNVVSKIFSTCQVRKNEGMANFQTIGELLKTRTYLLE